MQMIIGLDETKIDDLIALAKLMHEENASHLGFDAEFLRQQAEFYINTPGDQVQCFMAYKDGEAIGFLVGVATPFLFTPQICARQELWFVKREHRGSPAALKLMRVFEAWAKSLGAAEINAGVAVYENSKAKQISEILSRMGYRKVGYYHRKLTGFNEGVEQ